MKPSLVGAWVLLCDQSHTAAEAVHKLGGPPVVDVAGIVTLQNEDWCNVRLLNGTRPPISVLRKVIDLEVL